MGIVVQNNDPLRQGRVKVFVPHITPTVYSGWTDQLGNDGDIAFKFLGQNVFSDIDAKVLESIKKVLPWASVAMPIAGEVASGRYHSSDDFGTTSDSSNVDELQIKETDKNQTGANPDGTGDKPGNLFDQNAFMLSDAFNNPADTNVNNVNKLSYNYKPETYSNKAKGAFAIPRVGAHVWVFFTEGDPLKPVVFAAAFGASDWAGIYDVHSDDLGQDYPGEYENFKNKTNNGAYNINTETYRNKYVINQKGGTLSFVNTDQRELLKLTHFSGSFKEFNNQANIELAVNNDQKLVLGDSFSTVRGTRNEYSQMDYDCVVAGDSYRKVGDPGRVFLYEQWKQKMNDIADTKQLFDIQRCDAVNDKLNTKLLKINSTKQKKAGVPALCPVCTDIDTYNRSIAANNLFTDVTGTFGYKVSVSTSDNNTGSTGAGGGTETSGGILPVHQLDAAGHPLDGQALYGWTITPRGVLINSTGAIVDNGFKPLVRVPGFMPNTVPKEKCPLCLGPYGKLPGFSPSSFGGVWVPDPEKIALPLQYARIIPELAKIEAAMGKGGTEVIEIEKNKIETIGLVMNDWGAIRVDMFGKCEPAQVQVHETHTAMVQCPTPLVEVVQVDDLPGGTYTLNVANRYSLLVGAGGMNMKSYGVVNISGAMTNITGEQVNIGSALEVTIDGGKRLALVADVLTLTQRDKDQVLVDSDLGVTGKTVIRGSLFVEGPIFYSEAHTVGALHATLPHQHSGSAAPGTPETGKVTPMGTAITSDTAHLDEVTGTPSIGSAGVDIGADQLTPVYMGYNDTARVAAVLPEDLFLGVIPAGTKVGVTLTQFNIPIGGGMMEFSTACPVIAKKNVTEVDILASGVTPDTLATARPLSLTDISEKPDFMPKGIETITMIDALGEYGLPGAGLGAYIPGAGYGGTFTQENLPLRGLPKLAREKLIKEMAVKQSALNAPIVCVGDGGHYDAITMAPTKYSFLGSNTKLATTVQDHRADYIRGLGQLQGSNAAFSNNSNVTESSFT